MTVVRLSAAALSPAAAGSQLDADSSEAGGDSSRVDPVVLTDRRERISMFVERRRLGQSCLVPRAVLRMACDPGPFHVVEHCRAVHVEARRQLPERRASFVSGYQVSGLSGGEASLTLTGRPGACLFGSRVRKLSLSLLKARFGSPRRPLRARAEAHAAARDRR